MSDTYDLLAIAKTLDDVNGEVVGTDSDLGMNYTLLAIGMSGQEMVDKMNANWKATDAQFKSFNDEIAIRVISNNIQEIKEEDGTVSYTTDGENWISLQSSWGSILGDITKQTDLYEILGNKVETSTFTALQTIVNKNKDDILTLSSNVVNLSNSLSSLETIVSGSDGIEVRLSAAETSLETKVTSETIKAFRSTDGTTVEFTTDNETWNPISQVGTVEWGDITGDITNQADLQSALNALQSTLEADITNLQNDFSTLSSNVATQINSLSTTIDELTKVSYLTEDEYDALETKDSNTVYIVSPFKEAGTD